MGKPLEHLYHITLLNVDYLSEMMCGIFDEKNFDNVPTSKYIPEENEIGE